MEMGDKIWHTMQAIVIKEIRPKRGKLKENEGRRGNRIGRPVQGRLIEFQNGETCRA
jgi:hypothetical protein